jgi:outer membrane protein assembly factor BamA
VSGNLASLAHRVVSGEESTDERPYEIFGSRFSQYSKLSTDFRYFTNYDEDRKLATRIIIGAGIPYGNSVVMPYSKQFFSGGPNSIRAFLPRTVGPGSYITPEENQTDYLDQSGDIKLELNLEYRFPLVSVLKGAIFSDAGNVWLVRANEFTPGGEFKADRFYKEIAMGVGFGFRIDLSFFLLRLDLSIPVRKPYREEGNRWVFDEISLGKKQWRRDNLIYNIAIGYPF